MERDRVRNAIRGVEDVVLDVLHRPLGIRRERIGDKVVYTVKKEAYGELTPTTLKKHTTEGVIIQEHGVETQYHDEAGRLIRIEVDIKGRDI